MTNQDELVILQWLLRSFSVRFHHKMTARLKVVTANLSNCAGGLDAGIRRCVPAADDAARSPK